MKILFQGDSITDADRSYENDKNFGRGYPHLVKASLGMDNPSGHEFINRGISGNRVVDLYARIKKDILNVNPDLMSILIGVNDVWQDLTDNPNGVDEDKFFKIYDMLIEEIKAALPDIKIMILEPFVLKTIETEEKWYSLYTEVPKRAEMARKVAQKHNLKFVELQKLFDEVATKAPNDYWLYDGVHPTPMGHELIKREWIKAFEGLLRQ